MLGSGVTFFREIRRNSYKIFLTTAVMALGLLIPAYGQNVFNCSSFNAGSGTCGASSGNTAGSNNFKLNGPPSVTGSNKVQLIPANSSHNAASINYTTPVNVQAFTATYTFIPSGDVEAFVLQNTNNQPGYEGVGFYNGAGCEGGFYQNTEATESGTYLNNVFAISLDGFNWLNASTSGPNFNGFTTSTTNLYTSGYNPCHPNDGDPGWQSYASFATTPVQLNSPSTSPDTSTGDTYSVTITYDGSNVTESLYDVTAGGSCPGANCFTKTWTGVDIPSIVGGNTAIVGFTGSTIAFSSNFPSGNPTPLTLSSFSYTEGSTTQTAATPSFSPSAGTYSGSQNVALSSATSGAVICYNTTGSPATNGSTGCASGTRYTGPVTVSSNETMYAVAGASGYDASPMASSAYVIQPPAATPPIFSPAVGTYSSAQSVTISDATAGATIYYTTNGTTPTTSSTKYTGAIAVSATETLKAIAVASGDTNSVVASATYTITSQSPPSSTVSTPKLSVPGGTYTSDQSVSISDATSGATIYYTTNGNTPNTSSPRYSGPITVKWTETLKAIAVKSGDTNSAVASAAYTMPCCMKKK